MDKQDKDVLAKFIMVLGVLVLITVVAFLAARLATTVDHSRTAGAGTDEFAQMQLARINERIAPVGTVVSGEIPSGPIVRSGKEITEAVCTSCHAAGVLGAPKIGEAGDWTSRMTAGLDAIVISAINGKGSMPARGGDGNLTDEDVRKAVVYMLKESGQDISDAGPAAETNATAEPASTEPASTEETTAKTVPEAVEAAASVTTTVAIAASDNEGGKIYKSACFSCHDSGVANAPKLGDSAAWAERIAAGPDALYSAAVNGKGAMPPKGGRMDLSDDDIKTAVDYMVSQSQ